MKHIINITGFILLLFTGCDKEDISNIQSEKFVKYFTNFPEISAADVTLTGNTGYAILGTATTEEAGTQICFLRTDLHGNSIDSVRLFGNTLDDKAYCIKTLEDGGFALLGSSRNPATNKLEVLFIRTNEKGDVLWSRNISESGDVEARYFEVNDEGSFFLTGYYKTTAKSKEIWWFALDKDGNNLWIEANKFGFEWDDEGNFITLMPNGDLLLTGYYSNGPVKYPFVLRTDMDGSPDIFLPVISGNENINEQGNCIKRVSDNSFLLLTTLQTGIVYNLSLKHLTYNAGNIALDWEKTYTSNTSDLGIDLIVNSDAWYILSTKSVNNLNTAISLTVTDFNGELQNQVDFGLGSKLSAASFRQTGDGGFILVGTNEHAEENNTSIALFKITNGLLL